MVPSKSQVTKAGKKLFSSKTIDERNEALDVINTWRTNHLLPLITMKNSIGKLLKDYDITPILVSQRLKRITSIEYKLDLNKTMALGNMQDIGGIRIVVKDVKELNKLQQVLESNGKSRRYLLENYNNYIKVPKDSGYRSVHYIYAYLTKSFKFQGIKIELQIRTKLQHNWATAVETAGLYTKTSLKSSKGPDDWLDFFRTVSSLFAIKEKLPVLTGHENLTMHQLMIDCYKHTQKLHIIPILKGLGVSVSQIEKDEFIGDYYILNIKVREKQVEIISFARRDYAEASNTYLEIEKNIKENDGAVVLVSADSLKSLKKAYPSYFLDTTEFINALEKMNSNCQSLGLI